MGRQFDHAADANNRATQFRYDAFGRRLSRTLPGSGSPEEMTYNELGYLKTRKDFAGKVTSYEYDKVNRLLKKILDAAFNLAPVVFAYAASGRA